MAGSLRNCRSLMGAVLAGTAILFAFGPAAAADLPIPEYIPPPEAPNVFSWSGFYVGLHAGALLRLDDEDGCDWVSDIVPGFPGGGGEDNEPDLPPDRANDFIGDCEVGDTGSGPSGRADVEHIKFSDDNSIVFYDDDEEDVGFLGGGQIGLNWQTGMWVLGVEGDLSYVGDGDHGLSFELLDDQNEEEVHVVPGRISGGGMDWLATLRGRVGGAFGAEGRTLLYATGGAAFAGVDPLKGELFSLSPGDFGFEGEDDDDVKIGFVVGGGVEHALTNRVSVGLEALYAGFNDPSTVHLGCAEPDEGPDCNDEGQFFFEGEDLDNVIVRAKLNFLFGG